MKKTAMMIGAALMAMTLAVACGGKKAESTTPEQPAAAPAGGDAYGGGAYGGEAAPAEAAPAEGGAQ